MCICWCSVVPNETSRVFWTLILGQIFVNRWANLKVQETADVCVDTFLCCPILSSLRGYYIGTSTWMTFWLVKNINLNELYLIYFTDIINAKVALSICYFFTVKPLRCNDFVEIWYGESLNPEKGHVQMKPRAATADTLIYHHLIILREHCRLFN